MCKLVYLPLVPAELCVHSVCGTRCLALPWLPPEALCSGAKRPVGGEASSDFSERLKRGASGCITQVVKGADPRTRYEQLWGCLAHTPPGLFFPTAPSPPRLGSSWDIMVAKNRKQTGKSPAATQTDRDRSPLVSPPGKSNVRRPGREGKAFNSSHPNGLSGIGHKLGLTPAAVAKLGITLLLGELAC